MSTDAHHLTDAELAELLGEFDAPATEAPAQHPAADQLPENTLLECSDVTAGATLRNNWTEVYANRLPYPIKMSLEESRVVVEKHYQDKGEALVSYRQSTAGGRLTAVGGEYRAQGMPRCIRQTLYGSRYHDVDIKNCHPTIARALARSFGLTTRTLDRLVDDRDALSRETGKPKEYLLKLATGGGQRDELTGPLLALRTELQQLRTAVFNAPEFAQQRRDAEASWRQKQASGDTFENVEGCAISLVMQKIENEQLSVIRRVAAAHGARVGSLHFDGAQLEKASTVDLPKLLADCEAELRQQFGYVIRVVEKLPTDLIDLTGLTPEGNPDEPIADTTGGDEFDRLSRKCGLEEVGGPGVYNEQAVGDDGVSDLFVQSNWGTGKSQHNKVIIRDLLECKPTATILIISSRRSLSAQLLADLREVCPGVTTYSDIKGQLSTKTHRVSIWQIDSFSRIPCDLPPFDLVLIDEPAQLLDHIFRTSASNDDKNLTKLKTLMRRAHRLIVTDNDLTDAHVTAFLSIRPADKPHRVVRNVFQPWAGVPVDILTGPLARNSVVAKACEFIAAQLAEKAAGREWFSCEMPVQSRKEADRTRKFLETKFPGLPIKFYTAETDDAVKRADFSNCETAWAGEQRPAVIMYTGTVSVGVSCASPLISECFAFFTNQIMAATQSAQMMFRCRKLKRVTVAYSGSPPTALPSTVDTLCRWLILARHRENIPAQFRHDQNAAAEDRWGATATDADALKAALMSSFEGRLFLGVKLEHHRSVNDFVPRLKTILERAGLAVTVTAATALPAELRTEQRRELAAAGAEAQQERAAIVAANTVAAVEAEAERGDEEDHSDKTRGQKLGLTGVYLAKTFGVKPAEVTSEFVQAFEPLRDQYTRSKLYINGAAAYREAGPTEVSSLAEAARYRTRVGEVLGVAVDVETAVSFATDKVTPATNPAARALFDDINTHGLRVFGATDGKRRATRECKPAAVVAAVRDVLGWFGGSVTAQYKSARDRKQGAVDNYVITWDWRDPPWVGAEGVAPLPGPAPAALETPAVII